ncbi:MAG TPA: hypothetical protein VGD80_15155 [Kofleriaceae bacterium]
MTRTETMENGRQAAHTTDNPLQNMKPAYKRAVAEHGPLDWMDWTLGYCKELCGR